MQKVSKSVNSRRARGRGRYGETRLAELVNGVVVGRSKAVILPSGKGVKVNCNKPPDVVSELFSFENKYYTTLPKFLDKVMTQAVANAPDGHIPIGHVGGRTTRIHYFILREEDFLDLLVEEKKK